MRCSTWLVLVPALLGADGMRRGVLVAADVALPAALGTRVDGCTSGARSAQIRTDTRMLEVGTFEGRAILDSPLPQDDAAAPDAPEGCEARDHVRQGTVDWWVAACDGVLTVLERDGGTLNRWPVEGAPAADRAWLVRADDVAAVATVEGAEVVLRQVGGVDPGRPGFSVWPLPGGLGLDVPVGQPARTGLVAIHRMPLDGVPVLGVARAGSELVVVTQRPVDGQPRLVLHRARVGGW